MLVLDGMGSVSSFVWMQQEQKNREIWERSFPGTKGNGKVVEKKEGATDEDVVDALLRDLGVHVVGDNEPEEEPRLCTPRAVTARAGGWKVVFFQATN